MSFRSTLAQCSSWKTPSQTTLFSSSPGIGIVPLGTPCWAFGVGTFESQSSNYSSVGSPRKPGTMATVSDSTHCMTQTTSRPFRMWAYCSTSPRPGRGRRREMYTPRIHSHRHPQPALYRKRNQLLQCSCSHRHGTSSRTSIKGHHSHHPNVPFAGMLLLPRRNTRRIKKAPSSQRRLAQR